MRLAHLSPLPLLLLVACAGKDDDEDDDDGGSDSGIWDDLGPGGGGTGGSGSGGDPGGDPGGGSGAPCDTAITPTHPSDEQPDFYHRSPLEVALTAGTGDEVLTLTDADGGAVGGSNANDGTTLTFTPDAPLSPSARYVAGVTLCGSELAEYAFSTSELGTPTDGCSVTGRTYQVSLVGARLLQPAGVTELLFGQAADGVVFSATSQTSSGIEWISGGGSDGVQDACVPTVRWPRASWSDPHFRLGPEDAELHVLGMDIVVNGLTYAATVSPDCSSYAGGVLTGELDARVLAPLIGEELLGAGAGAPDRFCSALGSVGISCAPCDSDGETYCVPLEARDVSATATGGAIEEITVAQVANDPGCP